MGQDRIQFNNLERALSGDMNDLQDMAGRSLHDLLQFFTAARRIMASGVSPDQAPQSFTMGLGVRANAPDELTILPGVLSQLSNTWPAVPGALESNQRLGILRAQATIAIPAVASVYQLLEARVVDVVTVNTLRDVFDVPSQTFLPTAVDKQVERQIEFQITSGTATAVPAFSGDPWVPLLIYRTDGAGQVPAFPTTDTYDCRNDLQDIISGLPLRGTPDTEHPEAVVESWAAHSMQRIGVGPRVAVGGNYMARIGSSRVWLKSDRCIDLVADNNVTGAALSKEHIYLCPLIANGVTVWPTAVKTTQDASKGVLVRSSIAGSIEGPDNSAAIPWLVTGLFQNFDDVPAKRAAYVTSVWVNDTDPIGVGGYVSFTQNSAGRHFIRNDRAAANNGLVAIVNRATSPLAAPVTLALDMRTIIPDGARTAIIDVQVTSDNAGSGRATIDFRRNGETFNFMRQEVWFAPSSQVLTLQKQIELPVHESSDDGLRAAMNWEIVLTPTIVTPEIGLVVDVIGWSF